MASAKPTDHLKSFGLRVLASFLILWTPFFIFAAYRNYPIPSLSLFYSTLICAVLALAVGALVGRSEAIRQPMAFTCLVALFLDIQFEWFAGVTGYAACLLMLLVFWLLRRHLPVILSTTFAALLASTAMFGSVEKYNEVEISQSELPEPAVQENGAPQVIHLILDEHAGIQGIPNDLPGGRQLRRQVQDFFVSNGFRIFGNSISEYRSSKSSISGILNFTAGAYPYERYYGKKPYVLKNNLYFDTLSEIGYGINVYQSTYMDYCRELTSLIDRCYTYRFDGTNWLRNSTLSDWDKLKVFFGMYLQLSNIAESALKSYAKLDEKLRGFGLRLPLPMKWDDSPSSINAMVALDHLIDEVTRGPGGRLYFAHLLVPHGPYVFDSDCQLRGDVFNWTRNRPPHKKGNTKSGRALRYHYYFEQVRCVQRKLLSLFDRLRAAGRFTDSTIIVHGDHGSRIHRVAPRAKNLDKLSTQDYLDGFSTLFAAKSPELVPGHDERQAAVSQLLAKTIGRDDLSRSPGSELFIYLEGRKDNEPWKAVPWPLSN